MHLEMDAEAIRTVYQAVGGFEGLLRLAHVAHAGAGGRSDQR